VEHYYQQINSDRFTFPTLYASVLNCATSHCHFVELGDFEGKSAAYMAVEIINSAKKIRYDVVSNWEDVPYKIFLKHIEPVLHQVVPIRMNTINDISYYPDGIIDFLFIGTDNNILNNLSTWLPKVKPGGIVAGNNYSEFFNAINNYFAVINKTNRLVNVNNENCWLYNKPVMDLF